MKPMLTAIIVAITGLGVFVSEGAVILSGTSYAESFDGIGTGLPNGWTVRTGATSSGVGTEASLTTTATSWGDGTGGFKNVASADGLTSGATVATQAGSTDRALGIRQTGALGDPGAAFVLQIDNTSGFENFSLSVKLQLLNLQDRSTTWTLDYRIGGTGEFTTLGTYSDPGIFGSTTASFNASQLTTWNNQASEIWFRVVALSASTGANNRDTYGIDDFSLTFTAVPEPAEWGLISALGLLGVCGLHNWRERRRALRQSPSAS